MSYLFSYHDDEDDFDGSGEEEHVYRENEGGYNTHRIQEESINVVRKRTILRDSCITSRFPGRR